MIACNVALCDLHLTPSLQTFCIYLPVFFFLSKQEVKGAHDADSLFSFHMWACFAFAVCSSPWWMSYAWLFGRLCIRLWALIWEVILVLRDEESHCPLLLSGLVGPWIKACDIARLLVHCAALLEGGNLRGWPSNFSPVHQAGHLSSKENRTQIALRLGVFAQTTPLCWVKYFCTEDV